MVNGQQTFGKNYGLTLYAITDDPWAASASGGARPGGSGHGTTSPGEQTKTANDTLKPVRGIVRGLAISLGLWALAFAAAAYWI